MNISISYNWLKEFIKPGVSVEEFARKFSLCSQTIDRIRKIKPAWKKVVTAKILEIKPHPNADKLKLATVDAGQTKYTVVCGASNIAVGQVVPLALAGAELVDSENVSAKIIVGKAKIRGVESCGMLCSQRELGVGEDHTGIFILPADTKVGVPLEKVLSVGDEILEIEVTSNRPDCLSVIGLAREASAVFEKPLLSKAPKPTLKVKKIIPLQVKVQEPKLCPRYQGVVMAGVKVGPSPLWLQQRLMAAGLRPINNLVDITNYVMLEYGQPMHVFDYSSLECDSNKSNETRIPTIVVRRAKKGETILALDGNTYELSADNLVIADAKKPVAVAGVMGGELSAAIEKTKIIVFEAACFEPVQVRKTARSLNLFSESSNLFEKGLSIESPVLAMLRAVELCQKIAGGKVASEIIDASAKKYQPTKINFDLKQLERYLGLKIPAPKVKKILVGLGFKVTGLNKLFVQVPWWRDGDVKYDYDLIEEVARIYGYHNLPTVLPATEIPIAEKNKQFAWADKAQDWLAGLGFIEVMSYSLVSEKMITNVAFKAGDCLKLSNPLSADLQYLRPTLIAGVLHTVVENQKNFPQQKIFELSKVYLKNPGDLPDELLKLTGAIVRDRISDNRSPTDLFYEVKGVVEFLLRKWGVTNVRMELVDSKCPIWEQGQAVNLLVNRKTTRPTSPASELAGGRAQNNTQNHAKIYLGQFGVVSNLLTQNFGVDGSVGMFDFEFEKIVGLATAVKSFTPLPEFPAVMRDLAIVVSEKLEWQKVRDYVAGFNDLIKNVEYLSVYTKNLAGKKSLALRVEFRSDERTLKAQEIDEVMEKLVAGLIKEFGAKLR